VFPAASLSRRRGDVGKAQAEGRALRPRCAREQAIPAFAACPLAVRRCQQTQRRVAALQTSHGHINTPIRRFTPRRVEGGMRARQQDTNEVHSGGEGAAPELEVCSSSVQSEAKREPISQRPRSKSRSTAQRRSPRHLTRGSRAIAEAKGALCTRPLIQPSYTHPWPRDAPPSRSPSAPKLPTSWTTETVPLGDGPGGPSDIPRGMQYMTRQRQPVVFAARAQHDVPTDRWLPGGLAATRRTGHDMPQQGVHGLDTACDAAGSAPAGQAVFPCRRCDHFVVRRG
jgi:hypothetical protein